MKQHCQYGAISIKGDDYTSQETQAQPVVEVNYTMHLLPVNKFIGGIPALPGLILDLYGSSDCEHLSAHSDILAHQEQLGISYKDAAYCLYMV